MSGEKQITARIDNVEPAASKKDATKTYLKVFVTASDGTRYQMSCWKKLSIMEKRTYLISFATNESGYHNIDDVQLVDGNIQFPDENPKINPPANGGTNGKNEMTKFEWFKKDLLSVRQTSLQVAGEIHSGTSSPDKTIESATKFFMWVTGQWNQDDIKRGLEEIASDTKKATEAMK